MADIFITEEYTDKAEDPPEEPSQSHEEVEEIEKIEETQTCLDERTEIVDEAENGSDMTLKQVEPEVDQFTIDGLLVNPDDLLPPVVKLEKYVDSDITFNRQVVVRNLVETLRAVQGNQNHVSRVITVLCTLSDDYDPVVRSELMGQFPHIVAFCNENGLNNSVQTYMMPILVGYLGAENNQVRKAAHSALLTIVEQKQLDTETITEKLCRLVVHLTDSVHPEDLRTDSVQLMSKVAVLVGRKVTEELFLQRFLSLCEDKQNYVRKACASTFGDIAKTVDGRTTEEQLLPKFIELCKDPAWAVRKACAENFMAVSSVVSRDTRCNELTDVYMLLLKDQSRWVRVTAYQCLGPFISTFAEPSKTGLYYSDGKLVVCNVPDSPPVQNSPNDRTETVQQSADNNSSDVDRTNVSEPCDSIVPLSCSEKSLTSASEIPGIPCHVGNYSTVIEVSCQGKTATDSVINDAIDVSPMENDSQPLSQTRKKIVLKNSSFSSVKTVNSVVNHLCYMNDLNESGDSVRESYMWYDYYMKKQNPLVNGDCSEVKESDPVDFDKIQNSVSINGVCVSEVLSETLTCEPLSIVNCRQITNEKEEDCEKEDNLCSSLDVSQSNENHISLHSAGAVLDLDSQSNLEEDQNDSSSPISLNDESAFNSFQYWRIPLPDVDPTNIREPCVDIDAFFDHMKAQSKSSNTFDSSTSNYTQPCRGLKFNLTSRCNRRETENSFVKPTCRFEIKTGEFDKMLENKEGEPPPLQNTITAYDQDIVPPELLLCYLNMIDANWTEIAHDCAYSLPAVAITLGRKFWPCLKETFDALSSDLQGFIMMWKVRRTVASSMHQLAVILGPEITSRDLLPVFSRFIKDLDEVRIGILQHMSEFLREILPEERKQFLPSLSEFLVSNSDTESKDKNWRFRLILAEQLVSVADLYEPEDVREHLVPLSLILIQDKICEVRLAAVRVMAAVIRRMSQHPTPNLTKEVLAELTEKFIHSPKWFHRQLYVYICQEFIIQNSLPPDQFAEDALPQLLYLCWDRVPNVRIAIARCLSVVIWPLETFSSPDSPHRELLLQTIHTLQADLDVDVKFYANMVSTHECSCLQLNQCLNCIGANWNAVPIHKILRNSALGELPV